MVKGFKDFLLRGNIIDLAVAVVIGAAFGGVVTQFTKSFVEPLIRVVGGGGVSGGAFTVKGVPFDWAAFVNAVVNFAIVAAVVYFLVLTPMTRLLERRRRGQQPEVAATPEDIALLQQIRDLLAMQADDSSRGPGAHRGPAGGHHA